MKLRTPQALMGLWFAVCIIGALFYFLIVARFVEPYVQKKPVKA